MRVELEIEGRPAQSVRAKQVCSMFDVPPDQGSKLSWRGDVPLDAKPWHVGLIVGPSGAGKSTVARQLFGELVDAPLVWKADALVDDFDARYSVDQVAAALSSVGLNTIPAWIRPYEVLSNGEKFRASMARRLLEGGPRVVVDEFTSVVDRQVAKIGSHAVQKHVRKQGQQFVAVTCHYDVIDWLQPDWVLEPATMTFAWRSVQPRPRLTIEIKRVTYDTWHLFSRYHYLTAALNRTARCFAAHVDGKPVAFCATLPFPHPVVKDIQRASRTVCLPDWQGLGIAPAMVDVIASAYAGIGKRLRSYPAHPAYVRVKQRNPKWKQMKESGTFQASAGEYGLEGFFQQRPCAVFEYCGEAMPKNEAIRLLGSDGTSMATLKKNVRRGG